MSTNEELNKEVKEYTNTFVITFVVVAAIVAVIDEKDGTENVFRYESDGIMHGYHDIDLFVNLA